MLKNWMAERHVQEAREAAKQGVPGLSIGGPARRPGSQVADSLVIGREGDLVVADPEISRRHCAIRVVDGTLVVDDLQSLNGTWVNGKRIDFPTLLAIRTRKSRVDVKKLLYSGAHSLYPYYI